MHPRPQEGVVVIEPAGDLDVLAAQAFERQALDLLGNGRRYFVIGFEKVQLITSEGIRVLLELTRRLEPYGGALVLYGLNHRVRTILSVTRLIDRFQIVGSQQDAVAAIEARRGTPPAGSERRSSLTRLIQQLLGSDTLAPTPSANAAGKATQQKSALTVEVARLLEKGGSDPSNREER